MSIVAGTKLGRYEIRAKIGEGGMGEVYLAQDTKLDRKVALKILPPDVAADPQRLRRFHQEARAASALNHPNIAHIYEISEGEDRPFIAMEHVEGETLTARIGGRPLATSEIIQLGMQIADALDEAHTKGVIHRDVKPGNIVITTRGQAKVLDFGLAKLTLPAGQDASSEVITQAKTDPGTVAGTAPYMSPEQALGRTVDRRSDIFSFGTVLYEMATGRLPFTGATTHEIIDRLRHSQPDAIARFNYDLPPELERIIRKCLEKDVEHRYQTAHDLLIDLKTLERDTGVRELTQRATNEAKTDPTPDVAPAASTGPATAEATNVRDASLVGSQASKPFFTRPAFIIPGLLLIVALAVGLYLFTQRHTTTINSIAVLPLVNDGADPEKEYLADGITESLINSLSQLPNMKVMSRNSVFRYKGKETDAQTVANALGVQAVLVGHVAQVGDNISISAELVDARDNSHLWGGQYNRKLSDILSAQEEIAKEVSAKLRSTLTGAEQKRATRRYTDNVEAYQLYLRGRYEGNKFTPEGLMKSIEYFDRAIATDPTYALAIAGLADSYGFAAHLGISSPREAYPKAKVAAEKALALDDALPESHHAVGLVKLYYEWDFPAAEKEFKRAIELNPNYSDAHSTYSGYFKALRRYPEEIVEARRGQELDPLSAFTNMELGEAFYQARRYDEAIEQIRRALELDPHFFIAYHVRARAYEQKKMYAEAIADCQEWLKIFLDDPAALATLGHIYGTMGKRREAEEILNKLQGLSKQRYFSPYWTAVVYTGLGDNDQAFRYLEQAFNDRYFLMIWMNSDPRFDNLRSDPRFADLVKRMGLS